VTAPLQLGLFAGGAPSVDESFRRLQRVELSHGAWYEYVPRWVDGADTLFAELRDATAWQAERRRMYDREVDTPRLLGGHRRGGHPLVEHMRTLLGARYGEELVRVTLAWYRDGADSVAMHGDTTARDMLESMMASVSLGAPRRFLLKPTEGGPSRALELGGGDLLVMGGTIQRTWRHGIPKVASAGPRIAVMFRPRWGD
jgi:hypothetical protein